MEFENVCEALEFLVEYLESESIKVKRLSMSCISPKSCLGLFFPKNPFIIHISFKNLLYLV